MDSQVFWLCLEEDTERGIISIFNFAGNGDWEWAP